MNKIMLRILLIHTLLTFQAILTQNIRWQPGNWAFACDYKGGDLANAKTSADQCSAKCASTNGCTHYTWNNYLDGTCWMKNGIVSLADAFYTGDNSMVCGFLSKY